MIEMLSCELLGVTGGTKCIGTMKQFEKESKCVHALRRKSSNCQSVRHQHWSTLNKIRIGQNLPDQLKISSSTLNFNANN